MSDLPVAISFKISGSAPQQSATYTEIRRLLMQMEALERIENLRMTPPTVGDRNGHIGATEPT